jgi:hypothetical protein
MTASTMEQRFKGKNLPQQHKWKSKNQPPSLEETLFWLWECGFYLTTKFVNFSCLYFHYN